MPTPLQKPILSFPTPNPKDLTFVEFCDPRLDYYKSLEYGDLFEDQVKYPGARLTYKTQIETQEGMDQLARLVWCAARNAQEVYNAKITYSGGDTDFPIFTRKYLILRKDYVAATPKVKLTSLIGLTLNNGGLNYDGDTYNHVPLVFSGPGTGAEGFGVEEDGVIVAVYLTNGGTGYTSVPTVSALIGSGLSVTALLQPATALLIVEENQPAAGELLSLWVEVERIYETLPGPVIVIDSGYEDETGAEQRVYAQRVVAGTSKPAYASEYPASSGFFVGDAGVKLSSENANAGTLHVEVMAQPDSREAFRGGNYPVPDLWVPIAGYSTWPTPPIFPAIPSGPYQNRIDGLDFNGDALPTDVNHRGTYELQVSTPASPIKETYSYFIAPPGALPATFAATSQPGRLLPITRNTIHGAVTETYLDSGSGLSVVLENLRASTPSTYTDGETVVDAMEDKWKFCFMRRRVDSVEFPVLPNQ